MSTLGFPKALELDFCKGSTETCGFSTKRTRPKVELNARAQNISNRENAKDKPQPGSRDETGSEKPGFPRLKTCILGGRFVLVALEASSTVLDTLPSTSEHAGVCSCA